MKITAGQLRFCESWAKGYLRAFAEAWPKGMVVNENNLRQAIKLGFPVQVWMVALLSGSPWREFYAATLRRWNAYSRSPRTTRRYRNYLRSIIPDILKAAREMDKAKGKK